MKKLVRIFSNPILALLLAFAIIASGSSLATIAAQRGCAVESAKERERPAMTRRSERNKPVQRTDAPLRQPDKIDTMQDEAEVQTEEPAPVDLVPAEATDAAGPALSETTAAAESGTFSNQDFDDPDTLFPDGDPDAYDSAEDYADALYAVFAEELMMEEPWLEDDEGLAYDMGWEDAYDYWMMH